MLQLSVSAQWLGDSAELLDATAQWLGAELLGATAQWLSDSAQ